MTKLIVRRAARSDVRSIRFPYSVYFLDRGDAVIVFAVLHQHRNPTEASNSTGMGHGL